MSAAQHTLDISADNQPTVLERLLQVTRYRGFMVTGFNVLPSQDQSTLAIKLTVKSDHCGSSSSENAIQKLYHQLNKLFDINHVNLAQVATLQSRG